MNATVSSVSDSRVGLGELELDIGWLHVVNMRSRDPNFRHRIEFGERSLKKDLLLGHHSDDDLEGLKQSEKLKLVMAEVDKAFDELYCGKVRPAGKSNPKKVIGGSSEKNLAFNMKYHCIDLDLSTVPKIEI